MRVGCDHARGEAYPWLPPVGAPCAPPPTPPPPPPPLSRYIMMAVSMSPSANYNRHVRAHTRFVSSFSRVQAGSGGFRRAQRRRAGACEGACGTDLQVARCGLRVRPSHAHKRRHERLHSFHSETALVAVFFDVLTVFKSVPAPHLPSPSLVSFPFPLPLPSPLPPSPLPSLSVLR